MSVTPASDIPIAISYTGRDYYSLREQLIARIQDRIPTWTASDPADFGVALVEAFAYLGDVMSYYIDRNVNESFITTATQRDSVLNIAQTYGSVAAGYRQASVTLSFFNSGSNVITVPQGTVVYGDVVTGDVVEQVYFTTSADATSDPGLNNGDVTVQALSGRSVALVSTNANSYGELVGTSTQTTNMSFELLETPVVDGTVVVYVEEGSSYSKWTQVEHIVDYGPYDQVFTVKSDANNVASIYFGDGISGQMPVNGSQIRAQYTVGGGAISNVLPGTLINIDYVPGLTSNELTALQSVITVSNQETALGGSDPEPLSQIRYAAPLALRSNNRAVTLQDFANLASQVSGVGKAKAKADVWTSVTLYIAPTRVATDTDLAPGLDGTGMTGNGNPTIEFTTISANTTSFLADKTLIGTSVTVQPPTYVDAIITVQYVKFAQYTTAEIESALKVAIVTDFGYTNNDFGQTIYPQDIEYSLQQIPGIKTSKVTALHRQGDSGLATLIGATNEIFRFQEANISVGSA